MNQPPSPVIAPLTLPPDWRKAIARYQNPQTARSLWQVATSLLPYLALWGLMALSVQFSYWLTLLLAVPTAGFMVRTFIVFHDCCHGSFFKDRRLNDLVGVITGLFTFTPYHQWKHDHAIHHASAGNLDRRGVGDVMTLTVDEYRALPWPRRAAYRIMRNPLVMFTIGAFLVFTVFHRFSRPGAGRRERRSVVWTNLALLGIFAALVWLLGWRTVLLVQLPVSLLASAAGVWLFYVQHNFDGTYWERQERWDFVAAALQGSSFYKLPRLLQWFTGNIGFHHIHHLNPRVPNYLLPLCFEEIPYFQVRPLTLRASLHSLGYRLWDERSGRMVGYAALKEAGGRSSRNRPAPHTG